MYLLLHLLADAAPTALRLLMFTIGLMPLPLPAPGAGDLELFYRMEIVEACVAATDNRTERYICAKIPRYESLYRRDVGRCEVKGAAGEVTAWQILPRSKAERERLCVTLAEDAKVAIERIRESRSACRHLPKNEQLALYARGDCASVEGQKLSRTRWPSDAEVRAVEVP